MSDHMADGAAVLFANEAFYLAFQTHDLEAMDALWSRHTSVACIHPGWPALQTRDEVISSWKGIFSADESPDVRHHSARAFVTEHTAFVVCYERTGQADLVATNIFVPEEGGWKLVLHQAGVCSEAPEPSADDANPLQ